MAWSGQRSAARRCERRDARRAAEARAEQRRVAPRAASCRHSFIRHSTATCEDEAQAVATVDAATPDASPCSAPPRDQPPTAPSYERTREEGTSRSQQQQHNTHDRRDAIDSIRADIRSPACCLLLSSSFSSPPLLAPMDPYSYDIFAMAGDANFDPASASSNGAQQMDFFNPHATFHVGGPHDSPGATAAAAAAAAASSSSAANAGSPQRQQMHSQEPHSTPQSPSSPISFSSAPLHIGQMQPLIPAQPWLQMQMAQQQQQMQQQHAADAGLRSTSPPAAAAGGSYRPGPYGAIPSLTSEQQQRLYAEFIAGTNVFPFNAPRAYHQPPPGVAPNAAAAASSSSAAAAAHAAAAAASSPAFAASASASAPSGGAAGASSEGSGDDSEDDEDHPPPARGSKGRGKGGVKLESTPAGAHYSSPYYKGGGAGASVDDLQPGEDPNDRHRLTKRLARKAELARASRRRKKMYVQDLEAKVRQLGAKVEDLQAKASASKAAGGVPSGPSVAELAGEESKRREQQHAIRQTLATLLSKPDASKTASDLHQISQLMRQFVENSRERQAQMESHFDHVIEAITPGLQAKFAMWGLDQNDEFYTQSEHSKQNTETQRRGMSRAGLRLV